MKLQKLSKQKEVFHNEQIKKESETLKELARKHCHFSDNSKDGVTSMYHSRNYPNADEARKARHEHICNIINCGKVIPKGSFYYRRSFGRLWTIKACSIRCFVRGLPN